MKPVNAFYPSLRFLSAEKIVQASVVSPLVSTDWLQLHLADENLVILDGSFFLPAQQRDAQAEYLRGHIPGAQFFDIDAVADHSVPLPHMLPSPRQFAEAVGAMGVGDRTHVIAYDSNDFMASARLWWTFRVFGHDRVSVLDGGLVKWQAEGRAVTDEMSLPRKQSFVAGFRPELVRDLGQMLELIREGGTPILDARSPGRFTAAEPEPRAGLRGGHIPGSRNLSFRQLLDNDSRSMKSPEVLDGLYRQAGIDPSMPVVTTCGTGVTAAILALALYRLGNDQVAVYDGSWTEWGGRGDTPVSVGEAC